MSLWTSSLTESSLQLDEDFKHSWLDGYAMMLISDTPLTVEAALAEFAAGKGVLFPGDTTFPARKAYYWVAYHVTNTSLENTTLYTEVRAPHINHLRLYQFDDQFDLIQASARTGDHLPFDSRPLNHRFYVFRQAIAPQSGSWFLLSADKYNETIKIPIILRGESDFVSSTVSETMVIALCTGIYCIIIFCLLMLNIFGFSATNLSLLIYVCAATLYVLSSSGLGFQYLWPDYPLFNSLSRSLLSTIGMTALLIFFYNYFAISQRPYFERLIHKTSISCLSVNWLLFFLYYLNINTGYPMGEQDLLPYLQLGIMIYPIYLVLAVGFYLLFTFSWRYLAFFLANLGIASAIAINAIDEMGLLHSYFLREMLTMLALVVDFSVLLAIVGMNFYSIRTDNQRLSLSLKDALTRGARRYIEGQQKERIRLAQQIHDGVSSRLSGLQMRLSVLPSEQPQSRQQLVDETRLIADELRRFSHDLSSVVLERYGFIHALEELINTQQSHRRDFQLSFNHNHIAPSEKTIERELYFVANELIHNALKHSSGNKIDIEFQTRTQHYLLRVADNGDNYSYQPSESGLGLGNIEWRVNLLGGQFQTKQAYQQLIQEVIIPRHPPAHT